MYTDGLGQISLKTFASAFRVPHITSVPGPIPQDEPAGGVSVPVSFPVLKPAPAPVVEPEPEPAAAKVPLGLILGIGLLFALMRRR
jgi:hypothetical protein